MKTLEDLGREHGTDKVDPGYLPHYEAHFGHLRDKPIRLLEIGIASGASLLTWRDYFANPDARIYGVDIQDPGRGLPGCDVIIRDINTLDVKALLFGNPARPLGSSRLLDVVIDDGSHYSQDILTGFYKLWSYVKPGGWYVIEDLGTQWWAGWGSSIGHTGDGSPAIALLRKQLDNVLREPTDVSEVHAYKYIIFLRKSE